MKFFVGGEQFYNPSILLTKKKYDLNEYINKRFDYKFKYYTGGGIYSLYQILKNINFDNKDYCLLPSYLCPSILKPFDALNITYKFYKINTELNIDNFYLENNIDQNCKAILFINYFGFPLINENEEILLRIRKKGIVLIQDIVQSFFSEINLIGDFCFNSFRKFTPADGSVILSKTSMKLNLKLKNNKYLFNKTIGQLARNFHYSTNVNLTNFFITSFEKTEKYYYNNFNFKISSFSKRIIERFDLIKLVKRREYFLQLLSEFNEYALFKKLNKNCVPLGFPILIDNRNKIREKFLIKSIYCPIHWRLAPQINKDEFPESWQIANSVLTLPVNENISEEIFANYKKIIKETL